MTKGVRSARIELDDLSASKGLKRSSKLAEVLARDIVDLIVTRKLKPGDRLPHETHMTRSYRLGRGSVREGLRLLESQGIISVKPGPGGGPVVGDLTPRQFGKMASLHLHLVGATVGEVMETRLAIEPVIARLAAESKSKSALKEFKHLLDATDAADLDDDRVAYDDLSLAFHLTVAKVAGNRVLSLFGEGLKSMYDASVPALLIPKKQRPALRCQHRAIGDAILQGRALDAAHLMHDHMIEYGVKARKRNPGLYESRVAWV